MNDYLPLTLELLSKLVSFDTTSRESNLALIDYVQHYLAEQGFQAEILYNPERTKANLVVCIGPRVTGGILLSGHTDVVPVDGQQWHYPPFSLILDNERCYGRGTTDMKGFIACSLAMITVLDADQLKKPVWLGLSYDEEVGCLGVHDLVAYLDSQPIKPELCVVGEPTSMQPVNGHKGKIALRCQVKGKACHSAYTPQGVNAIHYASRLIHFILDQENILTTERNPRFDPPFSTLHVGTISGGEALNIVPDNCKFDMELRYLPGYSASFLIEGIKAYAQQQLLPNMRERSRDSNITFETLAAYPGLHLDETTPWLQRLLKWTDCSSPQTVSFGTEGGLYQASGITSVVCGPGSMEQGHKADEYIEKGQLVQCLALLEKIIQHLCEKSSLR
ncbi:acetylornithine deacetylase [Tatumella ptyseos]|uniref:acetylornithine deacetylase n=1 Tax=Tatumella ptyseos TaxID=82987 RepID=UPI0026EE5260|nr:acetylornithine deacetylase [Tatumella ptyseos]WKX25437.1 acetylornithine deacetylase [Tatumella ptyseos]